MRTGSRSVSLAALVGGISKGSGCLRLPGETFIMIRDGQSVMGCHELSLEGHVRGINREAYQTRFSSSGKVTP